MNAAETPKRHDFNFSMGEASKGKFDELMARCGHNQVNLIVARALALLAWVEDQCELGRTVGSIRYGEELDFSELQERPELLRPRTRPQLVTAAAPVQDSPPVDPEPTPAQEPTAAQTQPVAATNPKLIARPKVKPAEPAKPAPVRSHRSVSPKALVPDDSGPIKTFKFLAHMCQVRGYAAPVQFGGHSLPGNLYAEHLPRLEQIRDQFANATHFRITVLEEEIHFCGFVPSKGWCEFNERSGQWVKDHHLSSGVAWIYPVAAAIEYLKRHGTPSPKAAKYDLSCPEY